MEFGSKLKDLNMTPDEIGRFTKAFEKEEFRRMLHEYAEEISKPESKKKYEEEIKLLEQERGVDIQFIHPQPYRVLKTSEQGKLKCFINVCSNDMIGKPEFRKVEEKGKAGQSWSLPHSLTPGRPDRDAQGNKCTIYDVVFHPDTLHLAGNNRRFMEMVDKAAVEAVENGAQVKLDRNNVQVLNAKYKGAPHAAVMRKPLPGQHAERKQLPIDHLSFPYPNGERPDTMPQQGSPKPNVQADAKISLKNQNINLPKELTKPHYAIKYRSFIDLQDFRCSRDSAQSPRPREIVITIDLPLLRSAGDADLDVTEKRVVLESKKPVYRLELPMAYPVDENNGVAKFNKQTKQLIVTLPVLPLKEGPLAEVSSLQLLVDDQEDEEIIKSGSDSPEQLEDTTHELEDISLVKLGALTKPSDDQTMTLIHTRMNHPWVRDWLPSPALL
ncbi:hypothetical protein DPEC_G00317860 [Dallia pectoralis]|uniref:Uncharacterized protein n=1 Tax=Dallia pectoralis TaxID=75939 RepID=A0ACC2FD58_DALPE|nr:hypothetical protein DPEC_G00317860 [Dallia pectoralis]